MHEEWEMQIQSLGQEDPLEKEMTTHSSILAWEISQFLRGHKSWTWLSDYNKYNKQ